MAHAPIVSYILVSEFDILKGSTLRASHPTPVPNYDDNFFSNLMLPEGAHHHAEDTTIFFLNRKGPTHATTSTTTTTTATTVPTATTNILMPSLPLCKPPPVRGALLRYDEAVNDWIRVNEDDNAWCTFTVTNDDTDEQKDVLAPSAGVQQCQHVFVSKESASSSNPSITRRVPIHSTLQYARLSNDFASMYDVDDTAVGLLFKSPSDLLRFEDLLRKVGAISSGEEKVDVEMEVDDSDLTVVTTPIVMQSTKAQKITATEIATELQDSAPPFLYCLNLVRTRKDSTVKRGAVVKAVALCSPYPFFGALKRFLVCCLDAVFEQGVTVLPLLFAAVNSAVLLKDMPPVLSHHRAIIRASLCTRGMGKTEQLNTYSVVDLGSATNTVRISIDGLKGMMGARGMTIPVMLPRYLECDCVGIEAASIIRLAQIFRKDVAIILDAILNEKRVLFVSVPMFVCC